jgi:predicted nucleic-acid-binding Zn-ribbon protein
LTHKEKIRRIKDRRLHWLRKIKKSKGCENCGYNENPLALDFAHIDQMTKHSGATYGAASGMSKLYSKIYANKHKNMLAIKTLFKEIKLCKILCKNCHVVETYNNKEFERNWEVSNIRKYGQKIEERGTLEAFL